MALKLSEVIKQASTGKPTDPQKEANEGIYTYQQKKTLTDEAGSPSELGDLQRRADLRKAEIIQHRQAEEHFREAGVASRDSKAKILQGLANGENIYSLFLTACRAVGIATNDNYFYDQAEASLLAIYGRGFLEQKALDVEKKQTQHRLELLRKALSREGTDEGNRSRISMAIEREQKALEHIEALEQEGKADGLAVE